MYDTYVNAVLSARLWKEIAPYGLHYLNLSEKLNELAWNMKAIFRIWAASFSVHRSIHLYYSPIHDCVPVVATTPLWVFSSLF